MDDYKVEKLNSENYRYWSMRAQGILEVKNLWQAVDPGFSKDQLREAANKKTDHSAKSILYLLINNNSLDDIMDCKTAKEVWETLKQIHTKYDTWHGLLLLKDFVNRAKKEDETINEYLTRRNGLYHKVKNAGFEFSEKVQAGFAVLGLPNEYEYLARNLRADEDNLNMSYLKSKLVEEERRINNKNNIGTEPENVEAFTTKKRPFAKNEQFMKNKTFRNKPQFSKEVTSSPNGKYGQERFHQFLRCYRCLEIGHIGKNCPLSVNKIVSADESDYQEPSTSRAAAFSVMQQSTSMSILNHRQKTDSGTWILDSGCTDHMTSHREKFCSFIPNESVVEVAGGGVLRSTGYGDINLQLSKKNGGYQITLMKVLYVPDLNENLLSMSLAAERGMKVIFGSNNAKIISKQGEIIAESTKIGHESDQEDVTNTEEYLEEEEQTKERFAENEGENGTKSNEDELAESSNTRRTKFGRNVKNPSWMADYVVNDKDPYMNVTK
ncbi:hypothetical protein JTB14_013212 [Gonioctena quinquepunctata]|nr:hypothetical protein JTB14_013212 [Gonioctena quinquepunctata]